MVDAHRPPKDPSRPRRLRRTLARAVRRFIAPGNAEASRAVILSAFLVFWVRTATGAASIVPWGQVALLTLCSLPLAAIPAASFMRHRWARDPVRADGYVAVATALLFLGSSLVVGTATYLLRDFSSTPR